MEIDSYEKFCNALSGSVSEEERRQADLISFLQDWMVTVADWVDAEDGSYGMDQFLEQLGDCPSGIVQRRDAVSRIIDRTDEAVRLITSNMRNKIIQENIILPVYKIRKVNSYGINWLSRRPGRTIKEKIANSNASMMAVRRRQSVDTEENRLLLAFLREMIELIDLKTSSVSASKIRTEETKFLLKAIQILRDPSVSEIRRWENLPPNNPLLSDRNYGKIWRNWNELKEIDEIIKTDAKSLNQHLVVIFSMLILAEGRKYFIFPQVPIDFDYQLRRLQWRAPFFWGVDAFKNPIKISLKNSSLLLEYQKRKFVMEFKKGNLILEMPGNKIHTFPAKADRLVKYARMIIRILGCKQILGRSSAKSLKCRSAVVDFFQIRPHYMADDGSVQELGGRILFQQWIENKYKKFALPCDRARAIEIANGIETYSVISAVENGKSDQLADLARLVGIYIKANCLTFLFPDEYNEFQLSMVYKALHLAYPNVESFPRSMGVAFSLMRDAHFGDTFACGDFLLVLDLVCDDLSLTLIQSSRDDKVAQDIKEFGGMIWERHPTISKPLLQEIRMLMDKLRENSNLDIEQLYKLMGIQGLESEADRLSILSDTDNIFSIDKNMRDTLLSGWHIPITDYITRFLNQHKQIIGGAKVHIVSLVNILSYEGAESFSTMSYDDVIRGYKFFKELQNRTKQTLWKEHLPELAIKLLYGKFNLVESQTVQPIFNQDKKIPITRRFTLTKGKKEYRFVLVNNNLSGKKQYVAVVRNPAFPLKEDIDCQLDMTYRYGSENPYRLVFIPVSLNAGFAKAKVSWEPAGKYSYMDLPFPKSLKPMSWGELSQFKGKSGVEDLIEGKHGIIQYFKQISEGYKTVNLENYQYLMHGSLPERYFELTLWDQGEPSKIIFQEKNIECFKNQAQANFDKLQIVSFQLSAVTASTRYCINLLEGAHFGKIWRLDKKGRHYCIRDVQINESMKQVIFFENMFDSRETFSEDIFNISFSINLKKNPVQGRYRAEKIHNEDSGSYQPEHIFFAKRIRNGNVPPGYVYDGRAFFLLYTVFGTGNSALQTDTPPMLVAEFEAAKESWLKVYRNCSNRKTQGKIFALMSLCAKDIGVPYYRIANAKIDELIANPTIPLPVNMGYALGDCSSPEEQDLLKRIQLLESVKPLGGIRLLAKAAWGNPDFIMNVDKIQLLDYFDTAVESLYQICEKKNFGPLYERKITACLEYILAVYRLRSLENKDLNLYLSRNEPIIQKLYYVLEIIVDAIINGNLEINSFLKLDIPNKGVYCDIPDLLYALLVYVTGDSDADDIRIVGLSINDIEM